MNKTFKRIIIVAIMLIALAAAASALVLSKSCSPGVNDPLAEAKTSALNTVIDASGIKQRIDSEVRVKASAIAEEAGIPQPLVDNVIDSLAIPDWKATTLPEEAQETGVYDIKTDELTAQITTYDDPGIVTVDAYGQNVTMEVPKTAQGYLSFLGYLSNLK